MAKNKHHQAGVTLVETLVALAILGAVTSSILVLIAQNTRFEADARERVFAAAAADNIMVETLLDTTSLDTGEEIGVARFREYEWEYRRRVSETPVEDVVRIDIRVLSAAEQSIANVTTLKDQQ